MIDWPFEPSVAGGRLRRVLAVVVIAGATACGGAGEGAGGGAGSGTGGGATEPDASGGEITDAQVSALARAPAGWTYYKNRPDTLMRSTGSGHGDARLRTRYNARAASQLDAAGKVRANASFPDSSLVVKELISGSAVSRYAVMMKVPGSANAGRGWLWAYYKPNGENEISIAARGAGCTGCHESGIDLTRMNDSHP